MNGPAVSTPVMAGALSVRFRCDKVLVLAVLPLLWLACDGDTSDEQRAGSALCPNGSFLDNGMDPCAHCAGLACDPTDHCNRGHTQGINDCTCHAGHMVCCSSSLPPISSSCDYGGLPEPTCPATKPEHGARCEGPQFCGYEDPCCDSPITAHCRDTAWLVTGEWYCIAQHPLRCPDAGPDAPPDSSPTDAADAGD